MSKPDFDRGVCPLQAAIEHFGLAKVIADSAVRQMTVAHVQFLPDVPYRPARVLTARRGGTVVCEPERIGQYGDLVVVFKVLEKSQE